jgi:thiol-disulfide isomerase/thioredoxin
MKKSIIIWVIAAILVVVAFYTTKSYNANSSTAKNTLPQNQQAEQPATTPAPSSGTPDSGSQSDSRQPQNRFNLMAVYDFTLEDLQGNKVTLSELKGKKVYLNFWATWCPPCKQEMPDIEKLYQETKDSDLVILAIDIGEDKKTVHDFIAKNNYNFTVLLDTEGTAAQLYQITGIPTSYFVDTEGYLGNAVTGAIPLEKMKEYVNNLK